MAVGVEKTYTEKGGILEIGQADLELKLADFKDKNLHKLPELTQLNMTLLDRTDEQLRELQNRKDSLELKNPSYLSKPLHIT